MNDQAETHPESIDEIFSLKQRIRELEQSESELKQVEEELRESEEKYRNILENIEDGYFEVDRAGDFTLFNTSLCRILGYTREEMSGMNYKVLTDVENVKNVFQAFNEIYVNGIPSKCFEWEAIRKDGTKKCVEVSVSLIVKPGEKPTRFRGIARDITERKRAEQEMVIITELGRVVGSTLEIDELYERMTAEIRKLILFDSLRVNLFNAQQDTMNVAYVSGLDIPGRKAGESYPMRGTVLEEVIRTRRGMIVQSENEADLVCKFPSLIVSVQAGIRSIMSVPLIAHNELIGSLVIRSKKPVAYTEQDLHLAERIGAQIAGAIANAQLFTDRKLAEEELRESEGKYRNILESIEDGYFEVDIAGNLTFFNDSVCKMLGNTRDEMMGINYRRYTDKENSRILYQAFNKVFTTGKPSKGVGYEIIGKDAAKLYIESSVSLVKNSIGQPIGFRGIMRNITERKNAEKQLQDTLESLRKAVGTTIQILASAVEARDPYTAGHQIRSADLARTIAVEMGLSQDKIDGIRIAGSIHDIGKLSIPAEILSKPTKLSEIEFALIKTHSQSGFEMLKDVKSPWPLAKIVHQHHERMDGSGYPRNLKGEEICIEARILAVADTVEAMASHRPYRPGLGIDAALNEIEKNRGMFYDNAAADACLRLFREKGFQLAVT
jgi:PAS domain S-box-containing protein